MSFESKTGNVDVFVGLQRGDEGKGRFVDLAAPNYDVIARGNGGANAGHTVVPDGMDPIALHQIPSGIVYPGKMNIIGAGTYLDPIRIYDEIQDLRQKGLDLSPNNLKISDQAHLVMPHHVELDCNREADQIKGQGTTKSGIAYVARDKYLREGVRAEILLEDLGSAHEIAVEGLFKVLVERDTEIDREAISNEASDKALEWSQKADLLKPFIDDTTTYLNTRITEGDRILVEGAQAFWLDINHGMYPAVTSSSTTVNGLLDGLGISAKHLGTVTGVAKLVKSHVGGGPFVTEIEDPIKATKLRGTLGEVDSEYGTTTERARRVGYFDVVELRTALEINGVDKLVISKMDHARRFGSNMKVALNYQMDDEVLFRAPSSEIKLGKCSPNYIEMPTWNIRREVKSLNDLPDAAKKFLSFVDRNTQTRVSMIGIGPERTQAIIC
jgi:adenylosuccinate synthase